MLRTEFHRCGPSDQLYDGVRPFLTFTSWSCKVGCEMHEKLGLRGSSRARTVQTANSSSVNGDCSEYQYLEYFLFEKFFLSPTMVTWLKSGLSPDETRLCQPKQIFKVYSLARHDFYIYISLLLSNTKSKYTFECLLQILTYLYRCWA